MRKVMLVFLVGVPFNIAMLTKIIIELQSFQKEYEEELDHI